MNSTPPPEKLPIHVRLATPADTGAMLEITRTIWEGQDYVPQAWSGWLEEPGGRLVVAKWQGRVIGLSMLSRYSPTDWWLHGLRTHPEFEGRGVASALHDDQVGYWEAHGAGELRLATNSKRLAVHHLSARTGFEKIGEFTWYEAAPLPGLPPGVFRPLEAGEAPEALRTLLESESLDLSWGLIDRGWEWLRPSRDLLVQAGREERAWWWHPGGTGRAGLLVTGEDPEEEETRPIIEAAACPLDQLLRLLLDYRALAGHLGMLKAGWAAPLRPELEETLAKAGFERGWENSVYVFQKSK